MKNVQVFAFSILLCQSDEIYITSDTSITREQLGYFIAITDLITIISLLIFLIFVQRAIKLESKRHRDLMLETKEFSIFVKNLPQITKNFTIEELKSNLWTHITKVIK